VSTDTAQDQQDEIDRLQAVLDAKNAELEALRARLGAENADLRHRLEQFRTIFDNAASGITIQDSEGVITAANQTFMDMVGYDRDELLGLPATAVTHPDFVQHTRALVESARRGGPAAFHYEKKLLRKDGSTLWADLTTRALAAPDGSPRGFVCVLHDITDRKRTEAAIWESEQRLRQLVERLPVLIHAHDAEGNYVFWNRECERVLGYKAADIIGNPGARALLFPDPDYRRRMETLHGEAGDFAGREAETAAADGSVKTILWTRISGEHPLPGWAVWETGMDITERKAAENALRASEHEKKLILDTISECVLYQTPDKRILWANRAARSLAGGEPEELRGKRCYAVWHGYKKSCAASPCPVDQALRLGTPVEAEVEGEGGRTWLVKGYPSFAPDGSLAGAIEVATDITGLKRSEEAMRRARDLAENATKMKDEFLANMSHELRSPMNGVLGMLDVLLDTDLDAEQRDCIQTALQAGEGLLAIINDILDFSKLQADKIVLARRPFRLRHTVRTVCNTFREQSLRKGLDVGYEVDVAVPETVAGDEGRIRQILFNLVGNAVKFTHQGSVRVRTRILRKGADPRLARLLFTVTDTGIGIPADQLDSIFDPFVQLNWAKNRKYEGTGLGLGIVKRLVTLMGGIITVESAVGQGTTVHFWINVELPD
jgi:PAS domain S-box-containing protein